ncbi:hypothetical protein YC2023_059661 [Brassica napus]
MFFDVPQIVEFLCVPAQANRAFAEAIDVVRDKGVAMAVAVASAEDIDAANVHVQTFSEVKKAL